MQKKITFTPKAGDISPQGFNWVHFDFAAFFSGAFYQHNFKGKFREQVLKDKYKDLDAYLAQLKSVKRSDFISWDQKHINAFLINTYHASLIKLMISHDFKNLDKRVYLEPNRVAIFNKLYSLEEFIKKEMIGSIDNYLIAFGLKCFEKNCPEFRNTIYNFKNVESMVKVSAIRYFIDPDKKYVEKGMVKFPYIQSLFLSIMPKTQLKLKKDLETLLKDVQNGHEQLKNININKNL